jgi:hypothetical protein
VVDVFSRKLVTFLLEKRPQLPSLVLLGLIAVGFGDAKVEGRSSPFVYHFCSLILLEASSD